jgi:L-threonylcarbamoyladenylate synthase
MRDNALAASVARGAVLAYPTEGVCGLGCDPHNKSAVERILTIKGRSVDEGLILLASQIEQLNPYLVGLPSQARTELERIWPSPVTFLVPDNGFCPTWIRGSHASVALRVTTHPVVAMMTQALDGPVVSTSANRSGQPALATSKAIEEEVGQEIDGILDGELGGTGGASEIRDLISGRVIRQASE